MNKITSKIIESIESKFQYHPLLNNRSVVTYYIDKCLGNVDEDSEVMIINDNDILKVNIELNNDTVISVACDKDKIAAISNGEETYRYTANTTGGETYTCTEPIFTIYTYGTKIVCDECRKVDDKVIYTQSLFDFKEIECSIKETHSGIADKVILSGTIKPINAIIGERALFSIENNLTKKSKTTSLPKDGVTIESMYDSLNTYIGYEPINNQAKTL